MTPSPAQLLASGLLPGLPTAGARLSNFQVHPEGSARLIVEHGGRTFTLTIEETTDDQRD